MASRTGNVGIKEFLYTIASGPSGGAGTLALSNTFEVVFNVGAAQKLSDQLKAAGFNADAGAEKKLTLLCEEASLPGIMANTGQTTGVLQGEGQVNYAHTKSYQDMTLGWICDADLTPLSFLNAWNKVIFPDDGGNAAQGKTSRNRVGYPDDYQCEITVRKAERNATDTLGYVGGIYTLFNAWPYSIQSTPLSYGSSQLLKITASFYYRRWKFDASAT